MPRPTKVPDTAVQHAVGFFMEITITEAIEALEAANAVVMKRVELEHYVPTTAAQDPPARPRAPRVTSPGRTRGRPPAVTPTEDATPPPPETPPGANQETTEATPATPPADGSLPMPAIGRSAAPMDPVGAPGGRAGNI